MSGIAAPTVVECRAMPADPQPVRTGTLLWTPPAERAAASRLGRWLSALRGAGTLPRDSGYDEAHAWSVGDPGAFWPAVADELGIAWSTPP
ncbi:MAG TPA: hypothetical protein VFP61_06910, partial [Acidimicrobiales bacterium]|nr:hypothetical protein [Acidimicrobiales bacterium]